MILVACPVVRLDDWLDRLVSGVLTYSVNVTFYYYNIFCLCSHLFMLHALPFFSIL